MCMLYVSMFYYSSCMFCLFLIHSFFLFTFQFYTGILLYTQVHWFSLHQCPVFSWAHEKHFSFLLQCFTFIFTTFFLFVIRVFVSLFILPTLNVVYFFIRFLNILIIGIISSLSGNFKICVIYESGFDVSLAPSDFLSYLLRFLVTSFCWNSDMIYWVVGTQVYQSLG